MSACVALAGALVQRHCHLHCVSACVAFDTRQGRCVAASRANRQELIEPKAWQRYVNWLHQRLQRLQAVVHSGGWGTRGRQRHGNILDPNPEHGGVYRIVWFEPYLMRT